MSTPCPNHEGNYDCTPFCALCEGEQEVTTVLTDPKLAKCDHCGDYALEADMQAEFVNGHLYCDNCKLTPAIVDGRFKLIRKEA